MTLTPTALPVRGVKGQPAPLADGCSAPGCNAQAQHGHHIYPRSYLRGQPYDWVETPDGRVWSNRVGLCIPHHEQVTGGVGGHKARIHYVEGVWLWASWPDESEVEPLDPQPDPEAHTSPAREIRAHTHLAPGQTCASCGYQRPQERQPGPKRASRSWGVSVPADAELGAEVLDGWIEQFAAVMGLEGTKGLVRYHVLAVVLAWADQNMSQFIYDIKESAET